jgi:conjugal transfer/type IV secretion protein DotA/TraY
MIITARSVLKYTLLPSIIPMVRDLLKPGFGIISMSMAQIFASCGLLPRNHAYLNRVNYGRFGISHVILEGAHNLKFDRNHLDQVFIFFLLLGGIILFFSQFFILGFVIFTQVAHAATIPIPTDFTGFFVTADPTQDIAYIMMDRVFGIDTATPMFGSCVWQHIPCLTMDPDAVAEQWPLPYHGALQDLFAFYSIGLAVIGLIIFLYYIVTVLLETAESGTPFGRRFNHVWAPVRMVVALAFLLPVSSGLNGAQLSTLYVAKWGSSFATNGWSIFVDEVTNGMTARESLIADATQLVTGPQQPDPSALFQFYTILSTCVKMYAYQNVTIDAYLVKNGAAAVPVVTSSSATTWDDANTFYDGGDVIVVFGELNPTQWAKYKGGVKPFCGALSLPATDIVSAGSVSIQRSYYSDIIETYWKNAQKGDSIPNVTAQTLPDPNNKREDFFYNAANRIIEVQLGMIDGITDLTAGVPAPPFGPVIPYEDAREPDEIAENNLLTAWTTNLSGIVGLAVTQAILNDSYLGGVLEYGWAGAGMWYNKIAQQNGGLMAAVANLPQIKSWPTVMEDVATAVSQSDKERSAADKFNPTTVTGSPVKLPAEDSFDMAQVFYRVYSHWGDVVAHEIVGSGPDIGQTIPPHETGNPMIDFLNQLLGTDGLFSMAAATSNNIHPLAQLVIMGKYLFDRSIVNLGYGLAPGMIGDILSKIPGAAVVAVLSSFFWHIGMMTLAVGFVLYYVVPFLPFLYFFFQVGGWIKGLFEAMVGVPLWALAHIRIDGEGLPGPAALQGYFMIFELFLRPILTIFGLVGGIAIFAAQVQVLNEIFSLVTSNVTGFDQSGANVLTPGQPGWFGYFRGYVDQLFYTVIYAIIVYMLGTGCFKLVYMIPDKTLRWMGQSFESFGDEIGQSGPEGLVGKMYAGSALISSQIDSSAVGKIATGRG